MLGYSKREELLVLNLDSEICVDPKQRDAFRRDIEAHNYVRNFEVTLRRKDGTLLLAVESSFATRDSNGNDRALPGICSRHDRETARRR